MHIYFLQYVIIWKSRFIYYIHYYIANTLNTLIIYYMNTRNLITID